MDARSIDLMRSADDSPHHFQGDIFEILEWFRWSGWWPDLMIGHPPCTFMANSGNKHLYRGMRRENGPEPSRWLSMAEGAKFFLDMWELDIEHVALENPIMSPYALDLIGFGPSDKIHPWMFGHPEQKETWLWTRNLPRLVETNNVYEQMLALPARERARVHHMTPGPNRQRDRARTLPGVAAAWTEQYGMAA